MPHVQSCEFCTALVQLFSVSVSTSAIAINEVKLVPYGRPLGATLIAFGMAVLAKGELLFSLPATQRTENMPSVRPSVFRHAALFFSTTCAAPGTLPCCPPQRLPTCGLSHGTCHNRFCHPHCRALNPRRRRGVGEGGRTFSAVAWLVSLCKRPSEIVPLGLLTEPSSPRVCLSLPQTHF
jgi:hypothetical protein